MPAGHPGVIHYIAMEYVDGDTLGEKIHRDKLELKKSLEFLAEVGDALAKAHSAGIVHRDLKPNNIMIARDGYAKILDFGLAKLTEPVKPPSGDLREAATAIMGRTQPGMVMGTVGYMSPEQVQGKPIDQRSDIFSFGCILYEAATGRRPFEGESVVDSLYKVAHAQTTPIGDFNPDAPAELQRIIRKCLAKDPEERYQSIKDVAIDLRELIREYDSAPTLSGSYQPVSAGPITRRLAPQKLRQPGRWFLVWSVPLVVIMGIAFLLYTYMSQNQSKSKLSPTFETMRISRVTTTGKAAHAAISPDGKYVAYVMSDAGQQSLWVRQVATSSHVQIVPPSRIAYLGLTFSPDGNYIYHIQNEKGNPFSMLYQVPVLGGTPKKVLEDVDTPITFSPDGKRFAFVRVYPTQGETALIVVKADGSGEQKLTVRKQLNAYAVPAWSPDGKIIVCAALNTAGGIQGEIIGVRLADGKEQPIGSQRWGKINGLAWLSDAGGLIVSGIVQTSGGIAQSQISRVSYPSGGTKRITNDLNNYSGISLTANSSALVTVQTDVISQAWVVPQGDASRARQITSGSSKYVQLSWTPDGKIVYVSDASGTTDIWMMDSDGKNQKQLTGEAGQNVHPSVAPDGRYIVFSSNRAGNVGTFNVWRMDIDGGNSKQLTNGQGEFWPVCSPDGKWVIYMSLTSSGKPMLWKVPIDGGNAIQLTDKISAQPVISPDGKLIACLYVDEQQLSPPKVAIIPIDGGPPTKVLNIHANQYRWASNGKAITYIDNREGVSNIWSQPLDGGQPKQLTDFKTDWISSFDWSRDGRQLACARGIVTTDVVMISSVK